MKTLLATAVVAFSLAVIFAMAQANPRGPKAAIEITDVRGTKHVVTEYGNGSSFFRAGLPFDDNITDDYQKMEKASGTKPNG